MNAQTLSLWRQIESCRFCGKKRQWPIIRKPMPKQQAAND
jgi:hypothetical protein